MFSKIRKGFMVMALALTVLAGTSFTGEKASAATSLGCTTKSAIGVAESTLCLSKDSYSVFASIERGYSGTWNAPVYWTMYLERLVGENYTVVGTRTGYTQSGVSNRSNVEFTNVGQPGSAMRVTVNYYTDSAKNKYVGWQAKSFIR